MPGPLLPLLVLELDSKDRLKTEIKNIYLAGAKENKADPAQVEPLIDALAEQLSTAIDNYVQAEFAKLKTALIQPGAYTATSAGVPIQITPGTIKDYEP
jgi:hypothetical protein